MNSFGQVFYKDWNHPDFQSLILNGVYYIRTGNVELDDLIERNLESSWSVTPYHVIDEKETEKFTGNEIVLTIAEIRTSTTYGSGMKENIVSLISYRNISIAETSKYNVIGYMGVNGFNSKENSQTNKLFFNYIISALNDITGVVKEEQLRGIGSGFYKTVSNVILPKVKVLENKTLLVIGEKMRHVGEAALDKYGIKYKNVTLEEYEELEDKGDYCLLYFAHNSFTDISIFDLEDNSLIYTKHYVLGKTKFTYPEAKVISKTWKAN